MAFKPGLVSGSVANLWTVAAQDYFHERLNRRYLDPITILQYHDTFAGEGFSILAIQYSIVEFLESTIQGINYRYLRKGDTLGQYEYNDSRDLFVNFLCHRFPFSNHFNDPLGHDFYTGVRCGLLHEARTKNGWTIWGDKPTGAIVKTTGTSKVVYRNNFQKALLAFVDWYKKTLPFDPALQEASSENSTTFASDASPLKTVCTTRTRLMDVYSTFQIHDARAHAPVRALVGSEPSLRSE